MNKLYFALGLIAVSITAAVATQALIASEPSGADDNTLGEQQVEKLWADFAKPDLAAMDQFVAPGFQSLHEDGARDWAEERVLVAELKITPYALSNYKTTRQGDVLLVSYRCQVGETIAAARMSSAATPRLDVFQQINGEWKLLSHVNVRKIMPSTSATPMMIAQISE
jgi:hypothetical protein